MGSFSIGLYLRCVREALGLTHSQVCSLAEWGGNLHNREFILHRKREAPSKPIYTFHAIGKAWEKRVVWGLLFADRRI